MAYDIPSISDLEAIQLLNKHYAEVITSKKDGIASGLDITQTTNPITGVVRRTLYKILDDMDDTFLERLLKMAFTPVGTFTAGATLTDARQTLLWEVSEGGDGRYYSWSGSFGTSGKVVAAGSAPSPIAAGSWVDRTDDALRDEIRETVFQNMNRLAAEAGFNLVDGSFEEGANISGWPDVVWCQADGKYYQWYLDAAKTVAAGSTPASTGGIGAGAWVDRTEATLRADVYESVFQLLSVDAKNKGYNLLPSSFEDGAIISSPSDVLLSKYDGKSYAWTGSLPKTVLAGDLPVPVSAGAWLCVSDINLYRPKGPYPFDVTVSDSLGRFIYADDYLTGDDAAGRLQAVADYAESINAELVFNGNKTYKIKQTLYIGNFKWKTNGALFEIISDASFIQTGTADRKTEGAILTKSAVSAGYGYGTVAFIFDTLRYTFSRPVATEGVKTAFLLENVSSFICSRIVASTPTGQDTSKCIFDAYGGVQNVTIGSMLLRVDNVSKAEAFWIRNSFPSRDTKNINIGLIDYDYTGADEALAIYPFNAGYGGAPDVNNIVIGTFNLKIRGGGYGLSFIDLSGATYSPKRMRGIFIENVNIEVYATKANPFFVKADSCAPRIGDLFIKIIGLSGGSGSGFAVRGIDAAGQTESFKIDNLRIDSAITMPSGTIVAVYGLVFVDYAHITTSGGAFSYLIGDGVTVLAGIIKGTYTGKAVRNAQYIGKACSVYGVTEGVIKFLGKLYVDTAVYTGQILFLYSSATQTPESGVTIDADVILSGSGTVTRVVNSSATLTYDVPVDVSLRIKNPTNLTIPTNYYSGSYKLTAHDVVNVRSDGAVRIAQALSI